MQGPGRRGLLVQHLQEPQPFLMAMPGLTGADQLAREAERARVVAAGGLGHDVQRWGDDEVRMRSE